MAILLLDRFDIVFDLAEAVRERNGLVGVSTELSVQHLLAFYPQGIFPWYSDERFFYWFTIAPRTVLYPYQMHIGRSLAKTLRNKPYLVTSNHGFDAVISACAQAPRQGQDVLGLSLIFKMLIFDCIKLAMRIHLSVGFQIKKEK